MQPQRLPAGIKYIGMDFHIHDFALLRSDEGPCKIGHITCIQFPGRSQRQGSPIVTFKLLGRVSELAVPHDMLKDEVSITFTCGDNADQSFG